MRQDPGGDKGMSDEASPRNFALSGAAGHYAQYAVHVNNRKAVQKMPQGKGIPTAVHYPVPLHLQPVFAGLNLAEGSIPVAEAAAGRVLSLPMHTYLTDTELAGIVSTVLKSSVCRP